MPSTENPPVTTPDIDTGRLAEFGTDRLLREISRSCVAVKLSCHGVGYERKIDGARVEVDSQTVPDEYLSGARFRLIPADINLAVSRVASHARRESSLRGTPFVGGAYLIPIIGPVGATPADRFFEAVRARRAEYHAVATEYRGRWEAHVERVRTTQPEMFERIGRWLIDGEAFVARHRIDMVLFPLGGGLPPDFSVKMTEGIRRLALDPMVVPPDLAAVERMLPRIVEIVRDASLGGILGEAETAAWAGEAREATSRAVAEAVGVMIQEPLTEFAEALANVEGIVDRESRIQTATLRRVQEAYDKLQGFAFLLPADMVERVQSVGLRVGRVTPQDLNGATNRRAAQALAATFRAVREEMTSADAHYQAFGQFERRLAVD